MDITKKNFSEKFNEIENNLKTCTFIGFDAEFTAILSDECFKYRLFDKNEERYNKLSSAVNKMKMTQIGLTLFLYDRDRDSYSAQSYTFHLCPQVFGNINQSFVLQASTLKFLCKHNFDFNKFIYEGIPYLSRQEETETRQHLSKNTLFDNLSRDLEIDEEKKLQHQCSEVSKWLGQPEGQTMYIDCDNAILRYIIHKELRLRFPTVCTTNSLGNSNKILIYKDKSIEGATNIDDTKLDEDLMTDLLGFSRIFNLIVKYKKPIIGHNNYLDLLLLHDQFIGPLPKKYSDFKKSIHTVLPFIYDTKYISHVLGKKLTFDEVWRSNALQDLYEFFNEGKCKKLEKCVNIVRVSTPFSEKQSYHEAGWDSYCTGYIFTRLGHWVACDNIGIKRAVGPTEIFAALEPFRNHVNVIRGAMPYINLAGDDPTGHRPSIMYVYSKRRTEVNVAQVAAMLAGYGSLDVKPYGARAALVAVGSHYATDKILKGFHSNEYCITKFNAYRHSHTARVAMWSGALITGSLMLFLFHKRFKN